MFLLLAAPSAPAEITAPHVSSRGAAMGTGVSSPAALGRPARALVVAGPPGQAPLPGGYLVGAHAPGHPAQCYPGAVRRGGGSGPPAPRQPHLLLAPLSWDSFQLPLLVPCQWCQQQHSHRPGARRTLPALPPAQVCLVLPRLRPVPSPCARDAWCHMGAVPRPRGITLHVPPALQAGMAGPSVWKRQGALMS